MDKLVRVILANRKSLLFIYLMLTAYAVFAAMNMRQAVFPDVSFPTAVFKVDNGFAPLSEMERVFGKPIDSLIGSSVGVVSYTSRVERGFAEFRVKLDERRDFKSDFQLLKGKVSTLVQAAPTSTGVPAALTSRLTNSNNLALLGYSLVSPSASYLDLRTVVDTRVVPALQQVQGIGNIEVIGGSLPEVGVTLDPGKLTQYKLTPDAVSSQIMAQGGTKFLGTFTDYGKLLLGFSAASLTSADAIAALPIQTPKGVAQLSDIADVRMVARSSGVLTSTDRHPSVLFNVYGAPGVDVVSLSGEVGKQIEHIQASLPPDMKVSRWYSLADFVKTSLGSVFNSILLGLVIVSISVFAFLRNWRLAVPVVITMLVTIALSFIAMSALGQTLNVMTLAAISAAVGLVVDDATVIVENIARHNEMGEDNLTATINGTAEVLSPDVSGTLTTIAVFAPLALLTGITGFLFKASALVIVASLLISLVTAVTLASILSYWFMKPTSRPRAPDQIGFAKRAYRSFLQATLRTPLLVVLLAAGVIGLSVVVARTLPTTYLPQWDEGTFIMDLDTNVGTAQSETARQVAQVEQVIASLGVIQTYSRQIGDSALQSEQAHFYMHPKPAGKAGVGSVFQVMDELQNSLAQKFPNLNVDLHQILPDHFDGLSGKNNLVTIDVFGPTLADLLTAGDTIAAAIGKLPGIEKVKLKHPENVTQFQLVLEPGAMFLHNLTRAEVASQVSDALQGSSIGFISQGDQQAAIRVVYPDRWRKFSPSLTDMPIFAADGTATPLSALAKIELVSGPDHISRKEGHLYLSVEAHTKTANLGGNATAINAAISNLSLPAGAYAVVSGDWKRQVQAFSELEFVFVLALGLVFTLLLIFFRSYGHSLLILLNTLTSLSLVIFGIWVFRTTFNVPTFMGLISVVGIVVNNGILILAFLDGNLNKGEDRVQAIIDACLVRARPILMTSTAAILGFLPMALSTGRGGEMMQPFAAAVIYGVIGGVLSSLVLLPSMYVLGARFGGGGGKIRG